MSWKEKVNLVKLELFCEDWRTRKEIQEYFEMSEIESWHCFRWCSKLKSFVVEKRKGSTARAYMMKTR